MYVDFRRFLMGLCVVGVLMGAVFGLGIAVGRGARPSASPATQLASAGGAGAPTTPSASGPGAAAGQGSGGTASAGGSGGGRSSR
jgi:hypothetical protein